MTSPLALAQGYIPLANRALAPTYRRPDPPNARHLRGVDGQLIGVRVLARIVGIRRRRGGERRAGPVPAREPGGPRNRILTCNFTHFS